MICFRLKVLLAEKNMTQKGLAEKTGIRPSTVSDICNGTIKHLPVSVLNEICKTLNCQPADLIEFRADS